MVDSAESSLEALSDVVSGRTTEAFKTLGNDTRLAILLVLWEATDPSLPPSEPTESAVSFSALQERVGMRDSGQFNYHLDRLVGTFVEQTDEGYTLTTPAERILSAVFAGSLTDDASFEGEPIEGECTRCRAPTVIDYGDGILVERCTRCEGAFRRHDDPSGIVRKVYLPPVGLENRTPAEFHRTGNTWTRHRFTSMWEGVCPDCSGTVTTTFHVCEDHDADDGAVCEHCMSLYEIQVLFVCDVCKHDLRNPAWAPVFADAAVAAFLHDHGLDHGTLFDTSAIGVLRDAVEQVTVVAEEPLELEVTVEIDGDRLAVTLDADARVSDVTEATS